MLMDGVFSTAMKYLGLRQIDVARKTGKSQPYVSKLCNGDVKFKTLVMYLDYFGFDVRITLVNRQSGESVECSQII